MNNKIPNILFVARDSGGCGYYRCEQPAKFIKRMGLANTEVVLRNPSQDQLLNSDLVILQETGSVEASNIARFCLNNKIPYIAEFDDFIHHVSPHNVFGYPAWNPSTLYIHRAMELSKVAFAMTVSTPQMAREYFPYNPSVYVVPNYLDEERWTNPLVIKNDGKIRIGWMGGNAHADDLKMISRILDKIVKEFKGKVIFETMGMTKQELTGVFLSKDFSGSCPSCGYEGELHHFPGESQDTYPLVVASKGWDIALAPVVNNAFGNCKSDLKIKEYSAVGLPIIASPIVPYKEAAQNGAGIVFANSFEEWYNGIKDLVKNKAKREAMAKQNKEWIKKYWIQNNAQNIFEVYKQVLEKADTVFKKPNLL